MHHYVNMSVMKAGVMCPWFQKEPNQIFDMSAGCLIYLYVIIQTPSLDLHSVVCSFSWLWMFHILSNTPSSVVRNKLTAHEELKTISLTGDIVQFITGFDLSLSMSREHREMPPSCGYLKNSRLCTGKQLLQLKHSFLLITQRFTTHPCVWSTWRILIMETHLESKKVPSRRLPL